MNKFEPSPKTPAGPSQGSSSRDPASAGTRGDEATLQPYSAGSVRRPVSGPQEPSPQNAERQKRWKLVGNDALERSVAEAFIAVANREVGRIDDALLARLQSGFLVEFRKRIRGGGRSLRAVSKKDFLKQLERSNSELVAKRDGTLNELQKLEQKVNAIESGQAPDATTANGLRPAEVRALVLRFLEARLKPARTRDEMGHGLMEFANELVRQDRSKREVDPDSSGAEELLDRYRRRIEKLRGALSETEGQLEDLARRTEEQAEGNAVAQLSPILMGRESTEDRRALMQRLFEQNLALQKSVHKSVRPA